MILTLASYAFLAAALVAAYFVWIRPLLRAAPPLAELRARDDTSWWDDIRDKFAGIKGKLVTGVGMAVSAIVALHDYLIPLATGIDWTPIRALLPDWAWPLVMFAMFALIGWFRTLADRRE